MSQITVEELNEISKHIPKHRTDVHSQIRGIKDMVRRYNWQPKEDVIKKLKAIAFIYDFDVPDKGTEQES